MAGVSQWTFVRGTRLPSAISSQCRYWSTNYRNARHQDATRNSTSQSYWRLLSRRDSQEGQSFVTPDGLFTPTHVPYGTSNAVTHLQSSLSTTLLEAVKQQSLFCLCNCLLHESSASKLLTVLRSLFAYCSRYKWKLHPAKCVLYTRSIRSCGRIIFADGIRHYPKRLEGLLNMDCSTTGGQLQQFLYAMRWLCSSIPKFKSLGADLHEFMETVYQHAGKRTKRAVRRVLLTAYGWMPGNSAAFSKCKKAIA